jgi:uncharacterized protein YggU (UPF0235/DUF167 family)
MRVEVRVKDGNGRIEERDGVLIVYTTEKRKNNRANIDVIRQLSKYYSVQQASIRIITGLTSPKKVIEIGIESGNSRGA